MKFQGKMIVTDLDGTFYNDSHDFHPRNMEAVEYFKKNGGLFTVATGRVPSSLTGKLDTFATLTNAPAILCNGGFLYDFASGKRFMEVALDRKKAIEAIRLVLENFSVYRIRCSLSGGEIPLGDIRDAERFEGWTRVSFDDRSYENLCNIRAALEKRFEDDFAFMFACPEIFEFQAPQATKGLALDRLRELVAAENRSDAPICVYAVGDFENDLDMLRHADVSCCPENAIDLISSASRVQLCHCDDGAIADLISKIESGEA